VRAFQRRYGLSVSGLLDHATREELVPGLNPVPKH
jgi:Putative peptidoglycan binding domain